MSLYSYYDFYISFKKPKISEDQLYFNIKTKIKNFESKKNYFVSPFIFRKRKENNRTTSYDANFTLEEVQQNKKFSLFY